MATRKRRKTTTRKKTTPRKKRQQTHIQVSAEVLRDTAGVIWAFLAFITFMANYHLAGPVGEWLQPKLAQTFGIGVYVLPFGLLLIALTLFFKHEVRFNWFKNLGIFLLIGGLLGLIHMSVPLEQSGDNLVKTGGWIGFMITLFPRIYLSEATYLLLISMFLVGFLISFELSFKDLYEIFIPKIKFSVYEKGQSLTKSKSGTVKIIKPNFDHKVIEKNHQVEAALEETKKEIQIAKQKPKTDHNLNIIKPDISPKPKKEILEIKETQYSDWEFPSLDLLNEASSETLTDDRTLMRNADKIKAKLAQFGINVTMKDVHVGPTVTQYSLLPDEGVKLNKITALKDDLTLALAAKALRIEAPIPGKALVGIELPNEKRSTVHMREMLESKEFAEIKSDLRLALGRDVAGKPIIADLAKMPHLLIAGATGAGKSVGMNSFLISLLYQNSPQDLKFIMVDPKRVELTMYNSIPHLLTPVITEADKALSALKWAISEMMRRYQACSDAKCRNLEEYNEQAEQKMPKIVIVIDELADLMMRQYKKDTEAAICRLAQMARAVGMHLIIATQRPSVDVITGLIKANIPTRISFTVTSAVDSRTIIDSIGAEDLLGMGDMLFLNSAIGRPMRVQGIYVTTAEVQKVTNRLKTTLTEPQFMDITREESSQNQTTTITEFNLEEAQDKDELTEEAIVLIKQTGKASASLFQRHLKVGYARAARLLDSLEENGIVGPAKGAKPREIFIETGD